MPQKMADKVGCTLLSRAGVSIMQSPRLRQWLDSSRFLSRTARRSDRSVLAMRISPGAFSATGHASSAGM